MDALSSARRQSFDENSAAIPDASCANALPAGTRLQGFEILSPLGQGGFSIVYAAMDTTLQRSVAVKEYMPGSFASRTDSSKVILRSQRHKTSFDAGLSSFIEEARLLAQFKHPALVEVLSFWEENGTAYMAMPLYAGKTMRQTLRDHPHCASEALLKGWMAPVLDVLEMLHEQQIFHRDIAPDNIIIQPDGAPVLLDLGSARKVATDNDCAPTVVVKAGYAPIEQYAEDKSVPQGPWTDIYALGALLYYAVAGRAPTASVSRMMKDNLVPLSDQDLPEYAKGFLAAIDHALALQPADRPQSIGELREALGINDLSASQITPVSALDTGAVAGYEDEERTVILSAEELELLLRGEAKPAPASSDSQFHDLLEPAPSSEPAPHAFADMEEFLNPPSTPSFGKMLVPDHQVEPDTNLGVAVESWPEDARPARHGTALLWVASAVCVTLIAVSLTLMVLSAQDEAGTPARGSLADGDSLAAFPETVTTPVSEERATPQVMAQLPGADPSSMFRAPLHAHAGLESPELSTGWLWADGPVMQGLDGQDTTGPADAAAQMQTETGSSVLAPLAEIVTVELDADPVPEVATARPAPAPAPPTPASSRAADSRAQRSAPASRAAAEPRRTVSTGKVALNILPWGEVWVDGTRKGVTPPLRTLDLPVGRHNIEIRNPGFPSLTHSVDVTTGTTPEIVHEFISGNAGRNLALPAETTPAAPAVSRERRVVEQPRPAARPVATAARAEPVSYGYTDIRVRPWAEVWVNGEKKGVAPPLNELRLTEGLHTIEFRNPDFPTASRAVRVSSAARSTLVQFFD